MARAEEYAARAFAAYERHDFARAVQLYELAFEAAPSADILYNIARVYDLGLHDRQRAIEHYQRYVADPGAAPARAEVARARLQDLRRSERDRADRADAATDARLADIARDFPLDSVEPEPPPSQVEPARDGGLHPLQTAALTLGSMGLIGIGVGVGFGLAARARSDDWQEACHGNLCTSAAGVDAAESAERNANIATVGFAAGGGLLALGAMLWLIEVGNDRRQDDGALHLSPFVQASGCGSVLSGSF